MEKKNTFALRLRQYAQEMDKIKMNLRLVNELGLADDEPGIRTPSRQVSREALEKLCGKISGYCIAVDDFVDYDSHGRTETFFTML